MADMSVGRELLDVPLPDMVTKLSLGIASGQSALDKNSIETAKFLAEEKVPIVPALTETIAEDGTVSFDQADEVDLSLLQIGLNPSFYQFAEATIEVSIDIKTTTSTDTSVKVGAQVGGGFGLWSASVRAEVAHNRKFQKEVHGTSRLFVKMVPVPPPPRIYPEVKIVDNRKPGPEK